MARKTEQAFPFLKPHEDVGTYIPGMTLRDYFAAQALPLAMADYRLTIEMVDEGLEGNWKSGQGLSCVAARAYELADAMMEARK